MAVSQKSAKKKAAEVEKKELMAKMDRLFHIPPAKVPSENGIGMVTIEHKIGKAGGHHTLQGLMEKLGLESEHSEFVQDMIKQIKNAEERNKVINAHYKRQKSRANRLVSDYRRHLEYFYGNYKTPLIPAFAFVPISEKVDGLFIQGLVMAESLELCVGEALDVYAWTETVFVATKKWADLNQRATTQAKALMRHPAINKDIKQRLHAITQGQIPDKLGFNG